MADNYESTKRQWSFDPSRVEEIPAVMQQLAVYDTYFEEEDSMTMLASIVDQLLAELPKKLAEPVRLVHLTGLSYRKAAAVLGIDHKTVRTRAERGIDILRSRLTDTAWVASMLSGFLPEDTETTKPTSSEKIVNVLSSLNIKEPS